MKLNIFILFITIFLCACGTYNTSNKGYIFNKELAQEYHQYTYSLHKERTPILFNNKITANNCNDYLKMSQKYSIDESVNNQLIKSEYLYCDAMDILSKSTIYSVKNQFIDNDIGEMLFKKLDIQTFPSSLSIRCSKDHCSLHDLFAKHVIIDNNKVIVDTKNWSFTLETVAITKINNNETPDWIVWVLDESKAGNYRGYSTLILLDPKQEDKHFKAISYPNKIN